MGFFKTIDTLTCKVNDLLNKDKWDKNCVNPFLMAAAEEAREKEAQQAALKKFQSQIDNRNEQKQQEVSVVKGGLLYDAFEHKDENTIETKVGEEKTAEVATTESNKQQENVLPARPGSVLFPADRPESMMSLEDAVKELHKKEQEKVQPVEVPTQIAEGTCFYVRVTHTSTFPKSGSVVVMRACDNEYVWKNTETESEMPELEICPCCHRKVGHTAIEVE